MQARYDHVQQVYATSQAHFTETTNAAAALNKSSSENVYFKYPHS